VLKQVHTPKDPALEPLLHPEQASGFVSPAEDYLEGRLSILERLVKDPVNTYYAEADSDELSALGICKGTLFVYDTSMKATHNALVVLWYQGEWKVRQYYVIGKHIYLGTGKENEEPELVSEELLIRGVVTWSCRPHQHKPKCYVRPR